MTFVFKTPLTRSQTSEIVCKTVSAVGGTFKNDIGEWRARGYATVLSAKAQFFFYEKESECNVRVVFRRHRTDSRRFWKTFVEQLIKLYPDMDFGITPDAPYQVKAVLDLTGGTEQVHFSRTSGGTSLGGFLLGGLVFGTPGAIVGGLSGKKNTIGRTRTVYGNTINVRILWNDGLIQEREVDKREDLYQEIMNIMA